MKFLGLNITSKERQFSTKLRNKREELNSSIVRPRYKMILRNTEDFLKFNDKHEDINKGITS